MKIIIIWACILLASISANAGNLKESKVQSHKIKGIVVSDDNNTPLPSVTVWVVDSPKGVITNSKGQFSLKLEEGSHQIVFSMIGMEKHIFDIDLKKDTSDIIITLRTSSALVEGVVVIAEDPGMRMMRRVIERKKIQAKNIDSYTYLLYTRFVASTDTLTAGRTDSPIDTTIVSIFESYSEGYYEKPDKYFNEIIQRRQSVNIPPQANFVVFGTNINVYDDFITILGEEIYSPFHPDAPDFYDFILDTAFKSEETPAGGRIIVTPNSSIRRLFSGYINLDPDKLIPVSVELFPNKAVRLPFSTKLSLKQSFKLYENETLMPEMLTINTSSNANIFGIIQPRLDIALKTFATNYKINVPIADDKFTGKKVEASKAADSFDTLFWEQNGFIALQDYEFRAYDAIRRSREAPDSAAGTSFLDLYLKPITTQFAKLSKKPFTGIEEMLVYNRVKGVNLNLSLRDFISENLEYTARIGYGFADKRANYSASLRFFLDEQKKYNVAASYFNNLQRIDNPHILRVPTITWTSFITGSDYGDYYYGEGAEISFSAGFGQLRFIRRDVFERPTVFKVFFKSEQQETAEKNTDFSIFKRKKGFRDNPIIIEGYMNTIGIDATWNFHVERRLTDLGFYLGYEHSSEKYTASNFNFNLLKGMFNIRTSTLPLWRLDIRFTGGIAEGKLPPQRFFSLESSTSFISSNISMRGLDPKEFFGDRFFGVSLEHSFGEIIPGLIRIPNIAEFGIEFVTYLNFAFSQFTKNAIFAEYPSKPIIPHSTDKTADKLYYEVGLGLNRILLFFRVDITARLSQTVKPIFYFTITNATF